MARGFTAHHLTHQLTDNFRSGSKIPLELRKVGRKEVRMKIWTRCSGRNKEREREDLNRWVWDLDTSDFSMCSWETSSFIFAVELTDGEFWARKDKGEGDWGIKWKSHAAKRRSDKPDQLSFSLVTYELFLSFTLSISDLFHSLFFDTNPFQLFPLLLAFQNTADEAHFLNKLTLFFRHNFPCTTSCCCLLIFEIGCFNPV